jgi:hypothetical protein
MFRIMPVLLGNGPHFWIALLTSCVLTFFLYLAMIGIAAKFSVRL